MKYMLLIYGSERVWGNMSKEEMEVIYAGHRAYGEAMRKAGVIRDGSELKPVTMATSIRFTNGTPKTVDGPFAETKEQLAGFYLIEARDLNDAIQVASKIPPAREGSIEVRPVRQLDPEKYV